MEPYNGLTAHQLVSKEQVVIFSLIRRLEKVGNVYVRVTIVRPFFVSGVLCVRFPHHRLFTGPSTFLMIYLFYAHLGCHIYFIIDFPSGRVEKIM